LRREDKNQLGLLVAAEYKRMDEVARGQAHLEVYY
jgi:hypothetical protein